MSTSILKAIAIRLIASVGSRKELQAPTEQKKTNMKKIFISSCIAITCCLGLSAQTQFAAGIGASFTNLSPSIELAAKLDERLTIRAGVGGLYLSNNFTKEVRVDKIYEELGYQPRAELKAKLSSWNGNLLLDYSPFEGFDLLSFTGGLIIGAPTANFDIMLVNPNTGRPFTEDLSAEDHALITSPVEIEVNGKQYAAQLRPDGGADLKVRTSSLIRPYIGIGLGRAVAKSRVGWKLDLGLAFGSGLKATSPQMTTGEPLDLIMDAIPEKDQHWLETADRIAKFWPQLKLAIYYRIN